MAIELQTSLQPRDQSTGNTFEWIDVLLHDNKLVTVTGEPRLRVYDTSGKQLYADSSNQFGTFGGITLIAPACAVICNSGNQSIYFVDLTSPTYFKNFLSNGQLSRSTPNNYSQVIAGKSDVKLAAYCRQSGGIQLVNGNNFTTTSLSPAVLSANTSMCIINKDNSNNWLVGTSVGTIVEIASSGSVIQTVTLPQTPVVSPPMTTGIPYVYNLISTGPYVVASTPRALYLLNWGASSVLDTLPTNFETSTSNNLTLSNPSSGFFLAAQRIGNFSPAMITEYYITNNRLTKDGQLIIKTNSSLPSFSGVKIDYTTNKMYTTIDTNGNDGLLVFNISPSDISTVNTKIQDSSVDVAGRILRIRDSEFIGRSELELDTSIPLEGANLPAINGKSYIEIAIKPGSPEKYDIREFLA